VSKVEYNGYLKFLKIGKHMKFMFSPMLLRYPKEHYFVPGLTRFYSH